ncbi:MAG: peptidylprolyl isomerase [Gemmatimonadetes bacterium]|nr:peptidylprolyl isomerase [Gemmatimonadota bacterium]
MTRPALLCLALAALGAAPAVAQNANASPDTALVWRVLSAEDRRDSTDRALAAGLASKDPRVTLITRRALARIRDPRFAARDSLGTLPAPPRYDEPAWRLRFRALDPKKADCAAVRAALTDESWHVRLRGADIATSTCADDAATVTTLRSWLAMAGLRQRASQGAAWQAGAHALVALARIAPAEARAALPEFLRNDSPWVRVYAAHAAAQLSDAQALRALARDPNDNVKEAAIEALAKLTGRADDSLYIAALRTRGLQAVRAAALALKGAPHSPALQAALVATTHRMRADWSETARDARLAVLARLSEVADTTVRRHAVELSSDFDCAVANAASALAAKLGAPTKAECRPFWNLVPTEAVGLALGEDVRVRVVMSERSGGGSFVVRLRGDVAPITAGRVLQLVKTGYYNGRTWHRVEPDFVIQGLSPGDNEYVGLSLFFRDELGTVPHARGTVGMSTRGHDTGDAQWFVNLKDNLRLGRDYTVFGEIVAGIEVADGVLEGDVVERIEVVGRR